MMPARLLQHEAQIAQARLKAGDLSDSDTKQIEINAEQFELQAKSAEAVAVQARIAVEVLMALPKPDGNYISAASLGDLVEDLRWPPRDRRTVPRDRMSWRPRLI